jgi:hemerythrin
MDPKIVWGNFYSLGDDSLDAQHREILDAINDLFAAKTQGRDRAVIKTILDRLAHSMFTHIRYEEKAMQDCKYPDFARHKALHEQFWQLTRVFPDHVHLPTAHDQLCFFKDMWLAHIQEEDKKYMPFLRQVVSAGK